MRDAMAIARKNKRLSDLSELDMTTIRIEHKRKYTPLGRRIYTEERPSDIIRKCAEIKKEL